MGNYLSPKKALTSSQLEALDAMLGELINNYLEVILVPSKRKEQALRGKKIRFVVSGNADWYSNLCNAHLVKKDGRLKTNIKRQATIIALKRALKNKYVDTTFGYELLSYVPDFIKKQNEQLDAERASYERQKKEGLPKRRVSSEEDDWAPF